MAEFVLSNVTIGLLGHCLPVVGTFRLDICQSCSQWLQVRNGVVVNEYAKIGPLLPVSMFN